MERTGGIIQQNLNPALLPKPKEVTPDLLREIVARLVTFSSPDKIVLFGSRVRGNPRPDSDVDLLVIADSSESRHRRASPLYGALRDIYVPMDIVVYTPEEVKSWANVPQAFVTTACREGKVLYEKH